ncbi:MAG: hypothetical protein KDK41_12745 [Leptospiraceae bacterium]|nr:hypothetical protein [Leptospiraceae bacterium]
MEIPDLANIAKQYNQDLFYCGVGWLDSAVNLHRKFKEFGNPEFILHLGTAGVLHAKKNLLDTFITASYCQPPVKLEEFPAMVELTWQTQIPQFIEKNKIDRSWLYSTPGISISDNSFDLQNSVVGQKIEGPFCENMEAASLSYFCYSLKIPLVSVISITNFVGRQGRVQWKANFQKAGQLLAQKLIEILEKKLSSKS